MSDYKTIEQLCKENPNLNNHILSLADEIDKLERQNKDLEDSLIELKKYYQEYDKFAARINPPGQSYKELETKLQNFEIDKNREIDELWATKIKPLREKVEQYEKSLDLVQSMSANDSIRIRELQQVIKNLNTRIDFAVGYISATQPHTDKHPMEVKKWLFEGFERLNEI